MHVAVSNVNVPTTTETVVAVLADFTGAPVNQPNVPTYAQPSHVYGNVDITTGATVTAVTVRVRAGIGVGGAILYSEPATIGAAASIPIEFDFYDDAAAGVGGYTVTIQQTGATGAGTVNTADITQDAL